MKKTQVMTALPVLLCFLGTAHANVVKNPGFELPGVNGPSVTLTTPPSSTDSAAADWSQLMITGTFMTTFLTPTTDPFPGGNGNMLVFNSDGPSTGSSGNTVGQNLTPFLLPVGSQGSMDINLVSGAVLLGFVDSAGGGTFFDSGSVGPIGPTGGWQHVSFTNLDFSTAVIEIQLYAPAGGEALLFVDNVFASPVPEPASWVLLASGVGLLGLRRSMESGSQRAK